MFTDGVEVGEHAPALCLLWHAACSIEHDMAGSLYDQPVSVPCHVPAIHTTRTATAK